MTKESLYKVLGVRKNASAETIKKAHRRLSKKYHPDLNNGDDEQFKKINEAWQVLKDPIKKAHYDATGEVPRKDVDLNSKAAAAIVNIFDMWMSRVQQNIGGFSFRSFESLINVDLVAVISDSLQKSKNEANRARNDLEEHIKNMNSLAKRCKGGFLAVVSNKIDACNAKMEMEINPLIEQIEAAQEMIKDGSWTYIWDDPEEASNTKSLEKAMTALEAGTDAV